MIILVLILIFFACSSRNSEQTGVENKPVEISKDHVGFQQLKIDTGLFRVIPTDSSSNKSWVKLYDRKYTEELNLCGCFFKEDTLFMVPWVRYMLSSKELQVRVLKDKFKSAIYMYDRGMRYNGKHGALIPVEDQKLIVSKGDLTVGDNIVGYIDIQTKYFEHVGLDGSVDTIKNKSSGYFKCKIGMR